MEEFFFDIRYQNLLEYFDTAEEQLGNYEGNKNFDERYMKN